MEQRPLADRVAAVTLPVRTEIGQTSALDELFRHQFSGERWRRPLWASTSTKNPAYPDTLYVDELIGPDTVNTLPEPTIAAFADHGRVARTLDAGVEEAAEVMRRLAARRRHGRRRLTLEARASPASTSSFEQVLAALAPRPTSSAAAEMDWAGWALFGLIATTALTAVMIAAQLAGLTRLDLPLVLGTLVTADPDRARVAGFFIHLAVGQGFALGYAATFALLHRATWWLGRAARARSTSPSP